MTRLQTRRTDLIDATGLRALEDVTDRLGRRAAVILCGARDQPRAVMQNAGFVDHLGHENVCASIDGALARASELRALRQAV